MISTSLYIIIAYTYSVIGGDFYSKLIADFLLQPANPLA